MPRSLLILEDEMYKTRIHLLVIPALLIFFAAPAFSFDIYSMADQSAWRCGGGIVASGYSDRDVRNKCVNPIEVTRVQDVGNVWIYQPGQAKFMYYLAFLNGRLHRIVSTACSPDDAYCLDLR